MISYPKFLNLLKTRTHLEFQKPDYLDIDPTKLTSYPWCRTERHTSFCTHHDYTYLEVEDVLAPIFYDLIVEQKCFYNTNPLIDWNKRTLTLERDQQPLVTFSEALELTRCELVTAKQISRMLRKENVHSYGLLLDESPWTYPVWTLLNLLNLRQRFFLERPTDSPSLRPMSLRNLCTNLFPKVTFTRVRLYGFLLWIYLSPTKMEGYDLRWLRRSQQANHFPIPDAELLIDKTQGSRIFPLLDFWSEVRIYPLDIPNTAFVTQFGHWHFVPFGVTNAPWHSRLWWTRSWCTHTSFLVISMTKWSSTRTKKNTLKIFNYCWQSWKQFEWKAGEMQVLQETLSFWDI